MAVLLKAMCLAIIAAVLAATTAEAVLGCGTVFSNLAPCVPYVTGKTAQTIPENCCTGVKALNSAAKSTPDRKAACICLKNLVGSLTGLKSDLAAGLPGKCGVNIPYKISTSTDCATVK